MGPRAKLGRSWAEVDQVQFGPCWLKLAPSGAHVAAMSDRNGALADVGQICKMLKLPESRGLLRWKMDPSPAEAVSR